MKPRAMIRNLSIGILLLCVLCLNLPISGQTLQLKSRQFTPPNDVTDNWNALRNSATGKDLHAIIQLEGDLTSSWLNQLDSKGITLHAPIPINGYLATIPVSLEPSDLSNLGIRFVGEIQPDDKIHPRLKNGNFGEWSTYTDSRRIFAVSFFKDVVPNIYTLMAEFNGEPGPYIRSTHTWIFAFDPDYLYDLAMRDEILWIEELPPPMSTTNDIARQRTHAEQAQALPYDLRGDGVVVCVYDGGMIDQTHNDFGGRVSLCEPGSSEDHPTHVAGSVGSSGALNGGVYRGMAPEVGILSYQYEACNPYCLYNSPQDIEDNYEEALNDYGADICTNSIGSNIASNFYDCDWEGDYELTSQLLDEIVTGSVGPPFTILYAAGNERGNGRCGTTFYTLGVPAGAKNIITVGATDDNDQISSFTSWGPPDDGRLKPDVSAPGVNIYSTLPGNQYGNMSGTSMATPVTAGCIALMMEKFHRLFSPTYRPLPATIKALLCVSADDFGNAGPDYKFGHGRVNIQTAIDYMDIFGFLEGEIAQAESIDVQIQVTASIQELQVVLAWDDPAAVPMSFVTLINDLDLKLISPTSTVYQPLVTDPQNPSNPATPGRNHRDNIEHVIIQNPAAGNWLVRVVAYDIPGPVLTQTYALASNVSLLAGVGTISGIISDSTTGAPLEGWVEVQGGRQTVYATSSGEYTLYLPGDSTYTLIAHMFGYLTREATVYLPSGGSQIANFQLPTAAMGTVTGTVRNGFGDPLVNAVVQVLNTPITPVQTNSQGEYTLSVPGGDSYTFRASYLSLQEEETAYVYPDSTIVIDFTLINPQNLPTGPDNYGYMAYDNHEIENAAVFDWVEIDPDSGGLGTTIPMGEDETVQLPLPFTFTYYGLDYDTISVCCNGWVACGSTTITDYSNSTIPGPDGPPAMIAPFWEDFSPQNGGVIATWYDQAEGRFIIEYDHVPQWTPSTAIETFEVILYDPASHPTITGDGEILFMYRFIVDPAYCTAGIENHDATDGIQLVFDNQYDPNIWPLDNGLAVLFTTGAIPGYGSIAGQVTLVPANDPTLVTVESAGRTTHPAPDGTYQLDSVAIGTQSVIATLEGYETGVVSGVEVYEDSLTENVDIEMYRLDPPTNLQATRDDSVVTLWWHSPWELDQPTQHFRTGDLSSQTARSASTERIFKNQLHTLDATQSGGGSSQLSMESFTLYRDDEPVHTGITDTTVTDILQEPGIYDYTVTAVYTGGESDTSNHVIVEYPTAVGEDAAAAIPEDFFLAQNYPNPFNPITRIVYGLPEPAHVKLSVVNILGQQVTILIDDVQQAGYHRVAWNADRLASGLYFVVMEADSRVWIQKGLLLK